MLNPVTTWTPGTTVTYHGSLTELHGTYHAHPCTCLRCDDPGLGTARFRLDTTDGTTAATCVRSRSITPTAA